MKHCKTNLNIPTPERLFGVQFNFLLSDIVVQNVCLPDMTNSPFKCNPFCVSLWFHSATLGHEDSSRFPVSWRKIKKTISVLNYDCGKPLVMLFCSWLVLQCNKIMLYSFLLFLHVRLASISALCLCDIIMLIG